MQLKMLKKFKDYLYINVNKSMKINIIIIIKSILVKIITKNKKDNYNKLKYNKILNHNMKYLNIRQKNKRKTE